MESRVPSQHLILILAYAFDPPGNGWFTTKAAAAKLNIKERTVRHHLRRLVDAGVLEKRTVFGGTYYKRLEEDYLSPSAMTYLRRLGAIREVFEKKPGKLRMKLTSIVAMLAIV
jgi:DNA-binding transcriptional ArsR family regulator